MLAGDMAMFVQLAAEQRVRAILRGGIKSGPPPAGQWGAMESIKATVTTRVWGKKKQWRLNPPTPWGEPRDCVVELEIQGDPRSGYHLVMAPVGFFAADIWCETLQEALDDALETFGVQPDEWVAADEAP